MNTFIDFLRDIHAKDYVGLDDDMSDHFEHWLGDLDGEEYIEYANRYARTCEIMMVEFMNEKGMINKNEKEMMNTFL